MTPTQLDSLLKILASIDRTLGIISFAVIFGVTTYCLALWSK